jgi:hypothetical protein
MYWKQRGSYRYLYKAVRVDGRPHRIYVGAGEVGEAAAAEDEARRAKRCRQRELLKTQQQQVVATVSSVGELNEQTESLTRATLLAAGFHQHARSQWRRKRHANQKQAIG